MNLRIKVLLLATLPLLLAIGAITYLVNRQSAELSAQEIAAFKEAMVTAKKAELLNYVSLALTSIDHIYNAGVPETPESEQAAKALVKRVLNRLTYGEDGYFFVYDYEGRNLVHPKQPWRVGNDYIGLTDPQGRKVIAGLIAQAKSGGGYFYYTWEQPSTGKQGEKIGYAVGLDRWGWMLGTGIYVDDIAARVASSQAERRTRIDETFVSILGIALLALFAVFATGVAINWRESQLANARLRQLTTRIVRAQEDERGRISRELHDGISQILVAVKFALERAQLVGSKPSATVPQVIHDDLAKAESNLDTAIREVRRVSQGLRPGVLDDLGLREALRQLVADFSARTGIATTCHLARLPRRMPQDAETTLYRIAQEALANVERHAGAGGVEVSLERSNDAITLWVGDDGVGHAGSAARSAKRADRGGLGLRNMEERLEPFGGTLIVQTSASGTRLGAQMPIDIATPQTAAPRAPAAADEVSQ
ncbi:MAG: cache domain-containing protein [Pseudomonadota bacterium]